jgi:hypothetical protein
MNRIMKKRRRVRPRWMTSKDPVNLMKRENTRKQRREQRERGYDFIALDSKDGLELVAARLDGWGPDAVIAMCLGRFHRKHGRRPRRSEVLQCSLRFLGGYARGAYAIRGRNADWTFAFPRPPGAPTLPRALQWRHDLEGFILDAREGRTTAPQSRTLRSFLERCDQGTHWLRALLARTGHMRASPRRRRIRSRKRLRR